MVCLTNMKKTLLTLDEIHQEEFKILEAFAQFCDGHDLYYSLAGGTLLGAIRHKGFIPWDDDIDVNMPRPDFERLLNMDEEFYAATGFKIMWYGREKAHAPYFKIVDPYIRVNYDDGKKSVPYYLWIDVIPIDGIDGDPEDIDNIYGRVYSLRNVFSISEQRWALGATPFRAFVRASIAPFVMLFGVDKVCARAIESIAKQTDFETAQRVACITWGLYGAGEVMDKQGYLTPVDVEFCGKTFKGVSCWDDYLSGIYGDYMQLPPEDKRQTHHIEAWRVDG